MAEIAENLHRAELSVQERADHIAEWVRLTEDRQSAQLAPKGPVGHRPEGGINAAARELGIERTEAQRAVKIAGISEEARSAAADAGVTTQAGLLEVAREPTPDAQVSKVRDIAQPQVRCPIGAVRIPHKACGTYPPPRHWAPGMLD